MEVLVSVNCAFSADNTEDGSAKAKRTLRMETERGGGEDVAKWRSQAEPRASDAAACVCVCGSERSMRGKTVDHRRFRTDETNMRRKAARPRRISFPCGKKTG